MSAVPPGKRSWKCPECGSEVLLSVTQLDPMACDACLAKMKNAGKSSSIPGLPGIPEAVAAPLGMWGGLPETVKLGAVVVALVAGLAIGYFAGKSSVPPRALTMHSSKSHSEASPVKEGGHDVLADGPLSDEKESEEAVEDRPPAPGPGYKWVRGRKKDDGTRGAGHWAKDPRYKPDAK